MRTFEAWREDMEAALRADGDRTVPFFPPGHPYNHVSKVNPALAARSIAVHRNMFAGLLLAAIVEGNSKMLPALEVSERLPEKGSPRDILPSA